MLACYEEAQSPFQNRNNTRIVSFGDFLFQRKEDFLQLMMDAQEGKLAAAAEGAKTRDDELYNLGDDLKSVQFSSDKSNDFVFTTEEIRL